MIITHETALADFAQTIREKGRVALDTEFVWERTYYPILGIVQASTEPGEAVIIDTLKFSNFTALASVIEDPDVELILHDAQQDLIILNRLTGAVPVNVFDTRKAAGFAGLGSTISLRNLLVEVLGVHLAKTETRSNWIARPLSDRQIEYACDDVRYLVEARNELTTKIKNRNRWAWAAEELSLYDNPGLYLESDPFTSYLKVKGRGRLKSTENEILIQLAAWREKEARVRNVNRGRVISDQHLLAVVKRKPDNLAAIQRMRELPSKLVDLYGEALVGCVRLGKTTHSRHIVSRSNSRDPLHHQAQVELLQSYLKGKCETEKLDTGLFASKADLQEFVKQADHNSANQNSYFKGWRQEFAGKEMEEILAGERAVCIDQKTRLPQSFSV